ncbi:hypothetical protein M422DRAFT_48333 [Sphaerobolus stellatus SS14]|uniref:Uncharacterized protein n=1 Tax=Sphaerobolus stellatus (strain SS14) TaxID=990650 RepID=A0A0C9VKB8_SPHS4|nr:hypothetical protein M422DRAFT_48333 [Sphaerobolus stellatus SS14]
MGSLNNESVRRKNARILYDLVGTSRWPNMYKSKNTLKPRESHTKASSSNIVSSKDIRDLHDKVHPRVQIKASRLLKGSGRKSGKSVRSTKLAKRLDDLTSGNKYSSTCPNTRESLIKVMDDIRADLNERTTREIDIEEMDVKVRRFESYSNMEKVVQRHSQETSSYESESDDELLLTPTSSNSSTLDGQSPSRTPGNDYDENVQVPSSNSIKFFSRLLVWLLYSKSLLTLEELGAAIVHKPGCADNLRDLRPIRPDELLDLYGDYIMVIDNSETESVVQLADHTFIEYHTSEDPALSQLRKHIPDMHYYMASICTDYLTTTVIPSRNMDTEELDSTMRKYPFITHALRFWAEYVGQLDDDRKEELENRFTVACEENTYLWNNLSRITDRHLYAF